MSFREIAGHRHLFALVAGAAMRGSLPPSLIFSGPEGVGKRLAATALAQVLNCSATVPLTEPDGLVTSEPIVRDACARCPACLRIARGVHADVMVIEPGDTGAIKVDQIREAVEHSGYRPFEGRRRVVIVDEADAMVVEGQNALLKTLEEPPPSSVFVLVTARPELLLPTVRSRCQRLRFGSLAASDVADVLMTRHGYAAAEAHAMASASDGSVGWALEGASEEYAQARDAAVGLLEGVARSGDPRGRLQGARTLAGGGRATTDRDELARRLRALAGMLRDLAALESRVESRNLANPDLVATFRHVQRAFDCARSVRAFAAVDAALAALERNASPKIVADWVAFQV